MLSVFFALFLLAGCKPVKVETENRTDAAVEESAVIAQAVNRFAFDLYAGYAGEAGANIFFSPYSIYAAMAVAYEGAGGKTAEEMRKVFRFPESKDSMRRGYASLYGDINRQGKKYALNTANALWTQKDFKFADEYTAVAERYYGGKAENLDFVNAADEALKRINGWVEENTGGRIKNLIPSGMLDRLTRLVITNAVYFKGEWVRQFNARDTREEVFKVSEDKSEAVPMMRRTDEESLFNYGENSLLQILEMPYSGGEISMLILLPKNGDMKSLEENLSPEKFNEWKSLMQNQRVNIFMPKFRFERKYFMAEDLSGMGMPSAFSPQADFSLMTGEKDLFISDVIHQAFVEVNEEGTEAAAATAVVMKLTAVMPEQPIPVFRADRPFIFVIQQAGGNILFIGRVSNPA
ncbi:MAG: serpin family protein [Candidatus Omnitrophica bacterium]|nr:serpin family protein [Candidatus Omnitrophota bacterium]